MTPTTETTRTERIAASVLSSPLMHDLGTLGALDCIKAIDELCVERDSLAGSVTPTPTGPLFSEEENRKYLNDALHAGQRIDELCAERNSLSGSVVPTPTGPLFNGVPLDTLNPDEAQKVYRYFTSPEFYQKLDALDLLADNSLIRQYGPTKVEIAASASHQATDPFLWDGQQYGPSDEEVAGWRVGQAAQVAQENLDDLTPEEARETLEYLNSEQFAQIKADLYRRAFEDETFEDEQDEEDPFALLTETMMEEYETLTIQRDLLFGLLIEAGYSEESLYTVLDAAKHRVKGNSHE